MWPVETGTIGSAVQTEGPDGFREAKQSEAVAIAEDASRDQLEACARDVLPVRPPRAETASTTASQPAGVTSTQYLEVVGRG